jgi:fructose-bisphosphate aldolase class I
MSQDQFEKMRTSRGFIAALDQSGGSTPTALAHYGIEESAYSSEAQMFDLVHEMRARIITSTAFTGERILGAILFEMTMDREIDGMGTAEYLWDRKRIVPFLKVDKGLEPDVDGAQIMKPIPDLDEVLAKATSHGVFGTKMRSLISLAHRPGIEAVVDQQFALARRILDVGLVPIIEPEIDIHSHQKEPAEDLLKESILEHLAALAPHDHVMLKLTLPEEDGFYSDLVEHERVLRVVALSGGYARVEADERLERNHGVVASFSRALTEGLTAQQTDAEFDATLHSSVEAIYRASLT